MKPIYERWIYIILSLAIAICICMYNFTLIPHYDIGLNAGFAMISCMFVGLVLSIIEITLLCKFTSKEGTDHKACNFTIAIYWVLLWGWCYWKCVLEATRDWNDMMYGNVG